MASLHTKLEAILFSEGQPVSRKKLLQYLECGADELESALAELKRQKEGTGLGVIATDSEVALAIAPDAAPTVESAYEKELGREIGSAGLEVLAIILYRGHSTRAQIDYIRGVNTSSTIRTLTARSLLERIPNPDDAREYLYKPTAELLAHLGVADARELPDYAKITGELAAFEQKRGVFSDSEHGGDTASSTRDTDVTDISE
jgi:segregation and condensation protein B